MVASTASIQRDSVTSDDQLFCSNCFTTSDIDDVTTYQFFAGTCSGIKYTCPNCGEREAEFVPDYLT